MKLFVKFAVLAVILSTIFGCATSDGEKFEVRLRPPEEFNPYFLKYKELPGQKVLVVAVDPGGRWACAYDHDRGTLREAAENAAIKCDKARKKHNVFTKAKIFAINDEVVYYNDL
ncbi:hypothetical protein [Tichowtungia aerotolerans]|uniref:Uncharacterized protein n=1 Tax=Tichowtungia aerotolerans TaxID=2697043 RepID=A0A6P1M354_9BACT|nr:hypothetical protein [Tichowtungia aerotolerans]QHI69269.1 hypothetical protein GT409_07335 [Tichowtungia aerotolerans]